MENELAKFVIKSHTFLLDPFLSQSLKGFSEKQKDWKAIRRQNLNEYFLVFILCPWQKGEENLSQKTHVYGLAQND